MLPILGVTASSKIKLSSPLVLLLVFGVFQSIILWAMGRIVWCECHRWVPWSWDVWSSHNSQHFVDPYTLSHIEHGLILFLLIQLIAPRLAVSTMLIIVLGIESAWELTENTAWLINRYRSVTASLGYTGDSIINSFGDLVSCFVGFQVAAILPRRRVILIILLLEAVSVAWIKDGLFLNILMLLYPMPTIRGWQIAP